MGVFVEKKVGGAKNGETRMVRVKKLTNNVPTVDAPAAGTSKNFFSGHVRKVRASLTPGTVAIVLAGVHKGKRVVVLKQLGTGLLLVTGPHKLNGCPLSRVNQRYLVATSTKLDVSRCLSPRTSTTSTSPGLRLRSPRRETSSRPRRRPTSPLSRGRLIRLLLTLRSWPPSRATLRRCPEAVSEGHLLPLQGR